MRIIFNETSKTSGNPTATMLRTNKVITDRVKLSLKEAGTAVEGDEIVVRFGVDKASDAFDTDYDAYDLAGGAYNLYALDATANRYSIFHGSELKTAAAENRSVALGFYVSKPGKYEINANVLDAFTKGNNAYLYDAETGTYTLIESGTAYTFEVTKEGASENTTRFSIVFNAKRSAEPVTTTKPQFAVAPNPTTGKAVVTFHNGSPVATNITITNLNGKIVKSINAGIVSEGNITLSLSGFAKGVYIVQVVAGESVSHTKLVLQ